MTKCLQSKLVFMLCLSMMLGLMFSGGAQAEITVSDPVIDMTTGGNFPGTYGECFFLLPNPHIDRCEEEVGPVSYLADPNAYRSPSGANGCFNKNKPDDQVSDHLGAANVCFGNPTAPLNTLPVAFDGFSVDDFSVYRVDNAPDQAVTGVTAPDIAFAWSTIAGPGGGQYEYIPCPKSLPLDPDRYTTFDSEFIEDTAVTETVINQIGSISLAYYFVNAADVCRVLSFDLFIGSEVIPRKSGTIGDFSMGKYLVFELEGLSGATPIRLETTLFAGTGCENTDATPGVNAHISGVFIDNCEPPPDCSIGDYVWEDADRDGCQDPDERPIEGVEVTLFTYEDCDENPTGTQVTTTNAEGFYEFTGLDCGKEYRVQFGDAGDIYDYTEFESCLDDPPDPGSNDPTKDSDCNGDDNGFSGCVTFPDPLNNPNNPTIDCGYVCEGEIGDFVFLDEDVDGCQDNEPGIPMVDVTLSEDCDNPESSVIATTSTDENGKYMFTGLCPGDYFVEFGNDLPNTTPGDCRDNPGDPNDPITDSNCGDRELQCVGLTRNNPEDPTIDCGKVPPCPLEVTKEAAPDDIMCDSATDGTEGPGDCVVDCRDTGTDGWDTGTDGGVDRCIAQTVTYTITVTNPSNRIVDNIMVDDEVLGFMEGPFTLGPGQSKKITLPGECIKKDTTNTVVVTVDGEICDTAMAEVTVDPVCIDSGTDGGSVPYTYYRKW